MGYTIAIRPRSEKLKNKMLDFLSKNYQDADVVFDGKVTAYACPPTDDLCYDHAKLKLGFDYGMLDEAENEYVYALVRWMGLKIGKKRKWKSIPVSVPYMVYDGFEAWPIIVEGTIPIKDIPEDKRWAIYTKYAKKITKYSTKQSRNVIGVRHSLLKSIMILRIMLELLLKR